MVPEPASKGATDTSAAKLMLLDEVQRGLDPDLGKVIGAVAKTAQIVSKQLPFRVGTTSTVNPSGDKQMELDIFANEIFARALFDTGVVGEVASEEMEKPLTAPRRTDNMIAVAMDPLDGSSNITTNNPLGSIFGVWRGKLPQPGRKQIASLFVTYGPTLSVTMTTGKDVDQFIEVREGPCRDQFVLAYKSMKLPEKPQVYGVGGDRGKWVEGVEHFVRKLEERGMKLRYGGTFIGDYNQILKRGGFFSYPAMKGKPDGKLRILYETAPVSLITEKAGGASSDGYKSILDLEPHEFAQTSAFYVGNKELIEELGKELLINK
jgi:fructose-1,6-bisphosphatase I